MAPVAAVLCGRVPHHVEYMVKNLLPKIEVVLACTTVDAAVMEIPALLKGSVSAPSSGLGTNAEGSNRSDVGLIIVGGGYSPEEFQRIRAAVEAVKAVPFFVADTSKTPAGAGPPSTEVIKKRIMESIEAEEKGEGEWAPGVYKF
ncbi:hypothetical protein A1O1_01230 [Capronia coronata CBS 617.96]|uniref:Uncharacterized protein n=1 Tax=Capronia coronata CBS 617.96 TaxID=1182541 RepID=W9ZNP4_9EURO|nr:uncharacterized protein A1O1_01230 [Capronia coronata CBS 617.96]EXJ96104.1 hypothetical protein A1O1_01230 [Capronia coronata CBS 617.96]